MYVNMYVEDGIIEIFVETSAENDSNILTMNLSRDLHEICSKKLIGKKPEWFPRILKILKVKRLLEIMFHHEISVHIISMNWGKYKTLVG